MENNEKVKSLRRCIANYLTLIIDNDYVLLDLPYYDNIGDTLIWEGTIEFLKTLPYKCLYYASKDSFCYSQFPPNIIILLQGGGNFGDLYRQHSEFREKIISLYPNNKIVVLPQTVFYESNKYLNDDIEAYATHNNVTICARENNSFSFLKENFKNNVLLVPDMAFYIDVSKFGSFSKGDRTLYLKRIDKELVNTDISTKVPKNAEIHDWPTYERHFREISFVEKLSHFLLRILTKLRISEKYRLRIDDLKRNYFYRRFYVKLGIRFLSQYSIIYTTRLHVMILGTLMGKDMYLINNTSGKVINYYRTWLSDIDNIKEIH